MKSIQRNILKISSVSDLRELSLKLDEHVKTEAYIKKGENFEDAERWMWVWNIQKERIANSVSVGYQVIQHRDIFRTVSDALDNLNLNVQGRFDDFGDYARADIYFDTEKLIDDKKDGIKLGIRVKNSNNKRSSFGLEMFAFRMICQNGMSIGDAIKGIKTTQIHYGKDPIKLEDVQEMTVKFINRVINSSELLQKLVNESMADSVEWKRIEEIMLKLLKNTKYLKKICIELGIDVLNVVDPKTKKISVVYDYDGKINRWDLYNAITSIATHEQGIKISTEKNLEETSKILLKDNFEKIIEVYSK
jgi:hypothetical protein